VIVWTDFENSQNLDTNLFPHRTFCEDRAVPKVIMNMKHIYYIIATMIFFTVSCSNKKSPESLYPMDYPSYNTSSDSAKPDSTISEPIDQKPVNTQSSNYSRDSREKETDNMRGFDPASEDDMEDNGMSRYMENNDEEGWD